MINLDNAVIAIINLWIHHAHFFFCEISCILGSQACMLQEIVIHCVLLAIQILAFIVCLSTLAIVCCLYLVLSIFFMLNPDWLFYLVEILFWIIQILMFVCSYLKRIIFVIAFLLLNWWVKSFKHFKFEKLGLIFVIIWWRTHIILLLASFQWMKVFACVQCFQLRTIWIKFEIIFYL